MNIHDGKPGMRRLVVALALSVGACQDKPPEKTSGMADSARVASKPADAAVQKVAPENDIAKRAEAADTALAERVKTAIGADPALSALTVDVAASGNAVTLHGTADSNANRDRASLVALGVQGVNSVENRIVIVRGS
jgi:hyperosmotically inducible protein